MVYVVLSCRVREGKSKMHIGRMLAAMVRLNELLEAVCNILPKLIGFASLELLGHAILGLDDVELGLFISQNDLADPKIGSAHVKSQEGSSLVAIWE